MEALATALGDAGAETSLVPLDSQLVEGDVVVVDSYRRRADDRDAVRARVVIAIDDIDRDLTVNLVIDPSPPDGLRFALVDPTLATRERRAIGDVAHNVLVTTGGTDTDGVGAGIATALRRLLGAGHVRLVVGPWSASDVPDGVEAVRTDAGLANELSAADVVVCASGITLLEALVLGRPTVAIVTAENQRRYYDGLVAAGAVIGGTANDAAERAARLTGCAERRRVLADTARSLVDGLGAGRVAQAVVALG
jgi:spore coat polysaccharide biosynthesis predicted glycosyltransferase SpsG